MKTFNMSIAVLLLSCAASAQAGEPADPNLAATIRQQAMQAQASIRASALTDLHTDARRYFSDLSASTPLVLAATQPAEPRTSPL